MIGEGGVNLRKGIMSQEQSILVAWSLRGPYENATRRGSSGLYLLTLQHTLLLETNVASRAALPWSVNPSTPTIYHISRINGPCFQPHKNKKEEGKGPN